MKILIQGGRVINPATGFDAVCDVAIAAGRIVAIKNIPADFAPSKTIHATGSVVAPGLVDLCARLREPGYEHEGMLESELGAAVAGGVTSLVCPPDTDPVLDEPGLVEMLKFRAEKLHQSRVFPLGALTRNLQGETLTEMAQLTEAGCIGFGQAEVPLANTQVLQRAMQYAATFGYTVWLRPQELHLGKGVAASGALATRLGLAGVPVAAETIALHTIFELMRALGGNARNGSRPAAETRNGSRPAAEARNSSQPAAQAGPRVHLCRISSAAGVALVRAAKADGLRVTCDVSINSLHLTEGDIGYFDSRARLCPPLRQQRDRDALRAALADGTIDVLVSDHNPVEADAKNLPFAEAEPGATGLELLLSLALAWGEASGLDLLHTMARVTSAPAQVLGESLGTLQASLGQLVAGGVADVCVFDPAAQWSVSSSTLKSQSKHTPFAHDMGGMPMQARVRCTIVSGHVAYEAYEAATA